MIGTASIIQADARALPLPDASVDLVVTSPPYYALRSYTDGGEHYAGQIGGESTPQEYIANLIECTREWMRVLKPAGSIWVNLGDKYGRRGGDKPQTFAPSAEHGRPRYTNTDGEVPQKSLMLLPERYRIASVDQLGLIARAVVIWSKPNGLPESVTDRVRRSHEDWVHLTKQPRYFSAVDEIREATHRIGLTWAERKATGARTHAPDNGHMSGGPGMAAHPLGKLPGSVWEIATQPLKVPAELGTDHFAAFPLEWPRRIILGWSPSGICTVCAEGRRPVAAGLSMAIIGEACACTEPTAPTRAAVVLDPFGGTGTTALVAKALGRHGISIDRSADYCRLARWRTTDPGELAKAMRVEKPPAQMNGQASLFDLAGSVLGDRETP